MTHYTGIGTEIRESYHNESLEKAKVVINMPEGLGRYGVEDAKGPDMGFGAGYIPNVKFEWYLKNHLGSTMLVYGTVASTDPNTADIGETKATYDYRAFGEQVSLAEPSDKVTENFTGKERDDETELDYFGARYLDPMLGMWTSVDPMRQFASPYLYAGNGVNPVNGVDGDGNVFNPFGLMVGVGTGVAASWDAQAEYRRVSGENYSPVKETIVGVVVYGAYVAAGATGISGGLLKSTLLGGLIGGSLGGGSVAVAEILESENLEGLDGDKVAESFTKGFVTTASGAMLGAGVSEIMGGAAPLNFDNPSFGETVGGAVGGLTGLILAQCSTSEWDKDSAE